MPPESCINIHGRMRKINPTDKVLSTDVAPCPNCGDANADNRSVKLFGFQGAEITCNLCGTSLGTIGG